MTKAHVKIKPNKTDWYQLLPAEHGFLFVLYGKVVCWQFLVCCPVIICYDCLQSSLFDGILLLYFDIETVKYY